MSKKFTIGLLVFFAGVAGNLVAGWLQQGKWAIQPTTEQFLGTLAGAGLILFVVALLENEHALTWNWRWHRFWYLRELLKNPDLRHWETDFARLEMVQGRRKIFGAEVIAEGKRQDVVAILRELIIRYWEIYFARLKIVKGRRKFGAEVIVEGKRQDMVEVLGELIISRQEKTSRILVLGEPGSGKTTGLERLMLDMARSGSRRLGIGCKIPVLLRFGNFQHGTLLDYAAQTMLHGTKHSNGKVLSKGIKRLIEQGHVVFFCDAIDEALGERREVVLAELAIFLESQAYQNVPIVITSRTREDPGVRLKNLISFEIQDLSDKAVDAFIQAYKRPGLSDSEIRQRLESRRLLELGGLGRNPFWLRLIVESGAFKGNKGQILNTAVDTLLSREWGEKPAVERSWRRVLPRDEQLEETKRALAFLGYWMSVENLVTLENDGALIELKKWLETRIQIDVQRLRPQDVLGLGRDAQVLVYHPGPVRFRHRLLQEFMTAWMLMVDDKLRHKELDRCAQNTGWWETLFVLGGLVSAYDSLPTFIQLVQKVLGDGTNDQRLFAAIGLLRSVENPPDELANAVTAKFVESVDEKLTPEQVSAAQELGRILGDEATETFSILFHTPDRHIKAKGAALLCALNSERSKKFLFNALSEDDEHETLTTILANIGLLALEIFIAALRDPKMEMRRRAAFALGRIRDSRAVEPLIHVLNDNKNLINVRERAAQALGQIGDPRAIDPLITVLSDQNNEVRVNAVNALGQIKDSRAVDPLSIIILHDQNKEVRISAIDVLGQLGDPSTIKSLITILRDLDKEVRLHVLNSLEKIGDPSVIGSLITTAVCDPNEQVCMRAADVLRQVGGPSVINALIIALRDLDENVRMRAAKALGQIKNPNSVEPLITAALRDPDKEVRICAASALGQISDLNAVEKLITIALRDLDKEVRLHAVNALRQIGDPRAEMIFCIIDLGNQNIFARKHAVEVLSTFGDDVIPHLINFFHDKDKGASWRAVDSLVRIGAPAISHLIPVLCDPDIEVRMHAIVALERIGAPSVPFLLNALCDPDTELHRFAEKTLLRIGTRDILPFINALFDSDSSVCWRVAEILGKIGDPRAVRPLIAVLKESDDKVCEYAAVALARIGEPALESLIVTLKDSDDNVCWHVAEVLGKIGDKRALPKPERVIGEDKNKTWWDASIAKAARETAEKIRQHMAENHKETA